MLPANDPAIQRLVLTSAAQVQHPVFECDFVSGSFLLVGATVANTSKKVADKNKETVQWMTVDKQLVFIDIHTGIYNPSSAKVYQYVEFGPIHPKTIMVLCESTNGDISKLNTFLVHTLSQFHFTRKYGWRKNTVN